MVFISRVVVLVVVECNVCGSFVGGEFDIKRSSVSVEMEVVCYVVGIVVGVGDRVGFEEGVYYQIVDVDVLGVLCWDVRGVFVVEIFVLVGGGVENVVVVEVFSWVVVVDVMIVELEVVYLVFDRLDVVVGRVFG